MKKEKKAYYEIKVDSKVALPVYEQVKRAIKLDILSGQLQEGEKLMTLRDLALKLQINPNTIIKIYYQLELDGFIYSRPGSGYYVKLDKEKVKKTKYNVFEQETQDHISRAIAMGYSYDDILEILKRAFNRDT